MSEAVITEPQAGQAGNQAGEASQNNGGGASSFADSFVADLGGQSKESNVSEERGDQNPGEAPGEKRDNGKTAAGDPAAGFRSKPKEDNIVELRKKVEAYEKEKIDLQKLLSEKKVEAPSDYEEIKRQNGDMLKVIERMRVEESPRFKAKYDAPMSKAIESIQKIVKANGGNSDGIVSIIKQGESKDRNAAIADTLSELDEFSKNKITSIIRQYDELREARSEDLTNPDEAFKRVSKEQEELAKAESEKAAAEHKSILEKNIKFIEEKLPFFKKIEGNEDWNKRVDGVHSDIQKFWSGSNSKDDMAQVVIAGAMFPLLYGAMAQYQTENANLNKELAALRGSKPKNGSGAGDGNESANDFISGFISDTKR